MSDQDGLVSALRAELHAQIKRNKILNDQMESKCSVGPQCYKLQYKKSEEARIAMFEEFMRREWRS